MADKQHHLVEAASDLDLALVALRGVSALNHVSAQHNQDQVAAASELMKSAAENLRAADEPDLANSLPPLFTVRTGVVLKGTRLVDKWRAGKLCLTARDVRERVKALSDAPLDEAPPYAWHDAEGLVRIVRHPGFWVAVFVWNLAFVWLFSRMNG